MYANCQVGGIDSNTAADTCWVSYVPPVAVPFPNHAFGNVGNPNVKNIIYVGGPVHNLNTILWTSTSHGGLTGVASGRKIVGSTRPLTGANTLIVQGAPIIRVASMNFTNNQNTFATRSVPSQTKISVLMG